MRLPSRPHSVEWGELGKPFDPHAIFNTVHVTAAGQSGRCRISTQELMDSRGAITPWLVDRIRRELAPVQLHQPARFLDSM